MRKASQKEMIEFLIKENVLLKMRISSLHDLFALNYLSHGGYSQESFEAILVKPRQIENLRRILGCHPYLSSTEKDDILKRELSEKS